eukprot:1162020-Pelagomonas_calceolata.AAC.15
MAAVCPRKGGPAMGTTCCMLGCVQLLPYCFPYAQPPLLIVGRKASALNFPQGLPNKSPPASCTYAHSHLQNLTPPGVHRATQSQRPQLPNKSLPAILHIRAFTSAKPHALRCPSCRADRACWALRSTCPTRACS